MASIDRTVTMWAEMSPDLYAGESGEEVGPRWNIYAEGDMQDDWTEEPLKLDARDFPPGTKVLVLEPLCPHCKMPRPLLERGHYATDCECGSFNWDEWVEEHYS